MATISVAVLIASVIWAFSPSDTDTASTPFYSGKPGIDAPPDTDDERASLPAFPGMELWTKPPPVVTPPPPPPALRLNAELLAVRQGESDSDAVATLYLVDRGEIVRLKQGDELDGMTVEHVSESSIRFVMGEQTLTIKRQAD